ncbi:hypothetical protein JV474_004340 [Escherichia coli]|nr:hypothetical protein [Escherichia coli]
MVYRYSIKKAGPGKNNSNQGKGENQQFSERDALSGGKGHHGKSVIVNLKKHHCIEGASLDGCIDSLEVRKKPGGHWIIRDLMGLDLVGLASL